MKKMNEYTRRLVTVTEVEDIWRTSDDCLYTVYKDEDGNYYMDACDGGPNIVQLNGIFENDSDAVRYAQEFLNQEN